MIERSFNFQVFGVYMSPIKPLCYLHWPSEGPSKGKNWGGKSEVWTNLLLGRVSNGGEGVPGYGLGTGTGTDTYKIFYN